MKKVTYFVLALVIMGFVACKSNKADDAATTDETMTTEVETGASETVDNAAKVDEMMNQESDDELFGTDVDDAVIDGATSK